MSMNVARSQDLTVQEIHIALLLQHSHTFMVRSKNRSQVQPGERLMEDDKQHCLPQWQTQEDQGKVTHEVRTHQHPFENMIFCLLLHQKEDALALESDCNDHQCGKKEERLVSHHKLSEPAHLLGGFFPGKVEEGNLDIGVHSQLI